MEVFLLRCMFFWEFVVFFVILCMRCCWKVCYSCVYDLFDIGVVSMVIGMSWIGFVILVIFYGI